MNEVSTAVQRTPAFVLEYEDFQRNLATIAQLQGEVSVTFLFALKGFGMHAVFGELASCAKGATASSLNEAKLAKEYFPDVHAYAPVYRDDEFDEIAGISSHITFNSLAQFIRFKDRLRGKMASLRINPMFSSVETALYDPCSKGSRLGVLPNELEELPAGVTGLHSHNLCESGVDALVQTLESIERHYGHLLDKISYLNLGGGHLVTRKGYDLSLFKKTITAFKARHPNLDLIVEPGAAFVWETGVLVTEILDIVENAGIKTLMLDTSFACHMPDCLEMPYTPRIRGAKINDTGMYRLGGCSCLAGDWVGHYEFDTDPRIGDRLVLEDMMHYTMVKTTMFNGVSLPDIGILKDGHYTVVASFTYDDYRHRLS